MQARSMMRNLIFSAACLSCAACSSENDVTIQGAGATFPAPVYKRWFLEYYHKHPEVRVNYQAIGSGAGITKFDAKLLDIGASDAFDKTKHVPSFFLPMTAGSVAICYNLPGGPEHIKLSRDVYARIFLGEITKWNDPDIVKDNPGVTIPITDITVVRRADSSGTTFAFTNHLTAIYPGWKKENGGPGASKDPYWKIKGMISGRGNAGVTANVKQTPGGIGYTELSFAELAKLSIASLQNKAGKFIIPNPETNLAAVSGDNLKNIPANLHIEIKDPVGPDAYPIVTFTWMIVKQKYDDPVKGKAIRDVLEYCLTDGQKISPEIGYIPLDQEVVKKVREVIAKIDFGS